MTVTPVDLTPRPTRHSAAVALVRPPMIVIPTGLSTHGPVPPVGLAYIAAVLQEGGHRVSVVDAVGAAIEQVHDFETVGSVFRRIGLSPEELVARIPDDVEVIGITLMFVHEWPQARTIAALARRRFPAATIVVGGETATSFWPWMFEQSDAIDHVVLGEGEVTALELVDRIAAGEPVGDLPGVVTRAPDRAACTTGLPTRIRHLDKVPRPAWELFDLDGYFAHLYFGVNRGKSMPMLATRGCPYKCSFCSSPQMWTTRYVVREPDDVVDELAGYVRDHGVENINFCDLTAITKRGWTLRFCDALDERGLDITWQLPVGTRAEALDAEVLRRMYETGCRNVTYAPESGSERMLEVFDKKVKLPHVLASLRAAHAIGLKTHVNVIIGHPAERWSDLLASLRLLLRAARAGCDDAAPIIFCPYPGSADFERLVAEGQLPVDESTCYLGLARTSSAARSFNPTMSARVLRLTQLALLAAFYATAFLLHPSRIVSFVRAQLTGRESTYLDQMVRSKRRARRLGRQATAARLGPS